MCCVVVKLGRSGSFRVRVGVKTNLALLICFNTFPCEVYGKCWPNFNMAQNFEKKLLRCDSYNKKLENLFDLQFTNLRTKSLIKKTEESSTTVLSRVVYSWL